jgi:uncharacterized membrane protein
MNIRRKLMLMAVIRIALMTILVAIGIYHYARQKLFYSLVAMVLATGLLTGVLIDASVKGKYG